MRPLSSIVVSGLALCLAGCGENAGGEATPPGADGGFVQDSAKADTGSCSPVTCAKIQAQCGSAPDGCGGVIDCGVCDPGLFCGGAGPNMCGSEACAAKTCAQLDASCGLVSDGCGDVLDCGTCPDGEVCGGGGANKCGTDCVPATCAAAGADCGETSDGCGGKLDCGACSQPETCGGGGTPKRCGCTPTTCGALGATCGTPSDGCGGVLSCGGCPGNQTCSSGSCGCPSGHGLCGVDCIPNGTCCTDSDCSGLNVCASPGSQCSCRTSPARIPIYRSFNPGTGDHLLSADGSEGPDAGYVDEGIKFYTYAEPCQWGLVPFHRVRNPGAGEHFYTASENEYQTVTDAGWVDEGTIGCIAESAVCGAVELRRAVLVSGYHAFTTSDGEMSNWENAGGTAEGTAGWVWMN